MAEMDRLLWCRECLDAAQNRARVRGWLGGGALGLLVAAYIWLVIRPDPDLIPALWVAVVVVAVYLGSRVFRELAFGWERLGNRRAVDARPPTDPSDPPLP